MITNQEKLGKVLLNEMGSINKLDETLSSIRKRYGLEYDEILQLLKKRADYTAIPIAIFNNELSPLENVTLYLSNLGYSQVEIAKMLSRDLTTIWTTLLNSKKKKNFKYYLTGKQVAIPVTVFSDRSLSILEHTAIFLKDAGYSNHEIADMVGKDDRTIWTVIDRGRRKLLS